METAMQEDLIEQELPPRPRRRLFSPMPVTLLCVLLTACGFIGGVLVEKGESSSSSSGSAGSGSGGFASRLAALRSGSTAASGGSHGDGAGATAALFAAGGTAGSGARGAATIGQVAYTSGHTLYVTDSEGNTIKITTSAASTVTKTVKSDVKAIHPGETVIVTGGANANGAVKADSIRVSEAGANAGGALGVLFGGGGGGFAGRTRAGGNGGEVGSGGGGGSTGSGAGGSGEGPVLFGK